MRRKHADPARCKYYYELKFSYTFETDDDKVFFAYCYPYTYSHLQSFLKTLNSAKSSFIRETVLVKSLSGADVPMLTVTSRLNTDLSEYNLIKLSEFDQESDMEAALPTNLRKKYIIITGRVHPGESNSSWMMQGFINFIVGKSRQAVELRRRFIFKIIPMINVDGVIAGNYRTSLSGNDLNRRYLQPSKKLHPEIFAIKNLLLDLVNGKYTSNWNQMKGIDAEAPTFLEESIHSLIDMHGHSRKKCVFIYGPQFSLSSDKYYRTRILPKLLGEETEMFRYHSSQFKYEHSKRKTARIVLSKECNITNCFTFEASFHGYFDSERNNYEFSQESYQQMGQHLGVSLYEQMLILEEEQRIKNCKLLLKKDQKKNAA